MLSRGFSLYELLIAIMLAMIIMMGIASFYPQFYITTLQLYQKNRLEETIEQGIERLIKDIRRAGFIANDSMVMAENAIEIDRQGHCIILRYDMNSKGSWQQNSQDPKTSTIFSHRFYHNNLEYQTGVASCKAGNWRKLFDPNEVVITHFLLIDHRFYIEIQLRATLTLFSAIEYEFIYYVKNENR